MTQVQFKENDTIPEKLGLEDGPKETLMCSKCGAPLINVWTVDSKEQSVWNIMADCCHCGDHSFMKQFRGRFALGITDYCNIGDTIYDDDTKKVRIITSKRMEYLVK